MPVAAHFGFRFGERSAERAEVSMPMRADYLQIDERLHGGVLATLADTAAVWLFAPALPPEQTLTSIEFKLNFVAPATLSGGDLRATARTVRRGKKVALADVDVLQGEHLVAKGLFTYIVLSLAE
jgi:uncharacterized protein (TIGR00369 family)